MPDRIIAPALADEEDMSSLINMVREGVKFTFFEKVAAETIFNLEEWSSLMHLSARTLQRYKREKRTFDPVQSERILQIALLNKKGDAVFGSRKQFNTWLQAENVALGSVKPRDLMDNTFGLTLLNDELGRIEHGILV